MKGAAVSLLLAAVLLPDPIVRAQRPGTWDLRPSRDGASFRLQLQDDESTHGADIELDRLAGLSRAQIDAAGPVQFALRRDAGTFAFDGVARGGVAAGTYMFQPSASFGDEFARRGIERPTPAMQQTLARADIGLALVDELRRAGPLTLAGLTRAQQSGVNLGYLLELRALGYQRLSIDDLVRLRQAGVGTEYIRELNALGLNGLTVDTLERLRRHGVRPEYVRAFQRLGYTRLRIDDLAALRSHGIEPHEVSSANAWAGRRLPVEQLTALASRGWRR